MTFKTRARMTLRGLYLALLTWGTVLIALRRWSWNQVPTQISAKIVFLTLLINCIWIGLIIRRWVRSAKPTKNW